MKKISSGISCFMFFAMVLLSSCAKDGPAGATGPAGPAGAAGGAGPAGPAGAAGAAGTANVIYSPWFDVTYTADTIHTGAVVDTVGFFTYIAAPKITVDMLTKGDIKVYFNFNNATNPAIVPLPYFDIYTNISITPTFYLTAAGVGTINLYSTVNASTVTQTGVKFQQYRYVLIPGGVPARSAIDWKNYASVKQYLNLKD